MDQICLNTSASVVGVATTIVTLFSAYANALPAPKDTDRAPKRLWSRIVHFIALDIVTAKQSTTPTLGDSK
jgi:hypothetical protein